MAAITFCPWRSCSRKIFLGRCVQWTKHPWPMFPDPGRIQAVNDHKCYSQKLGRASLQRQNAENLKQIFPEKEYRGLSPNFHIHVSVSELYIPTRGLPVLLEEICTVDWSWEYINRSKTHECGNRGWGRAIPRKGIYKRNCRCSVRSPNPTHGSHDSHQVCLTSGVNTVPKRHIFKVPRDASSKD